MAAKNTILKIELGDFVLEVKIKNPKHQLHLKSLILKRTSKNLPALATTTATLNHPDLTTATETELKVLKDSITAIAMATKYVASLRNGKKDIRPGLVTAEPPANP